MSWMVNNWPGIILLEVDNEVKIAIRIVEFYFKAYCIFIRHMRIKTKNGIKVNLSFYLEAKNVWNSRRNIQR